LLEGKIYEVLIMSELELQAHNTKKSRESFLEEILNKYAESGYKIAGVYKDVIFMENFDVGQEVTKVETVIEDSPPDKPIIEDPPVKPEWLKEPEKAPVFDDVIIPKVRSAGISKEVTKKQTLASKIKGKMHKK